MKGRLALILALGALLLIATPIRAEAPSELNAVEVRVSSEGTLSTTDIRKDGTEYSVVYTNRNPSVVFIRNLDSTSVLKSISGGTGDLVYTYAIDPDCTMTCHDYWNKKVYIPDDPVTSLDSSTEEYHCSSDCPNCLCAECTMICSDPPPDIFDRGRRVLVWLQKVITRD